MDGGGELREMPRSKLSKLLPRLPAPPKLPKPPRLLKTLPTEPRPDAKSIMFTHAEMDILKRMYEYCIARPEVYPELFELEHRKDISGEAILVPTQQARTALYAIYSKLKTGREIKIKSGTVSGTVSNTPGKTDADKLRAYELKMEERDRRWLEELERLEREEEGIEDGWLLNDLEDTRQALVEIREQIGE
jgi:SMC interacting uncharacterized protein involved in chromosome segregation